MPALEEFNLVVTKESLFDDLYRCHCSPEGGHRGVKVTYEQVGHSGGSFPPLIPLTCDVSVMMVCMYTIESSLISILCAGFLMVYDRHCYW